MKRLSFMAAILIGGLMFTTCDLLNNEPKEPEVNLKSVDFTDISLEGLTLLGKVEVKNNISVDIPFPKIDWDLNIIDIPFVDGKIPSGGTLKSKGTTEVDLPVSFTYENLYRIITSLTDDNATYKINMTAFITVPGLGELSFPFSKGGKVPIARLPKIDVASPPKASLTYGTGLSSIIPTGGNIEFSLNVKNNNNVAVKINDLSYALKIGNTTLTGGVTNKPNIEKGTTSELIISLPVTLENVMSIGTGLFTGNISNFSLTGNYKFGIPEFPLLDDKLSGSFTF